MPEPSPARPEIELQQGAMRLRVCPALGGAITHLSLAGFDLLRPWDGSDSVRRTGCFVLAPFSNRVGEAAFEQDGVRYPLRRLSADHPLPIHGLAWKRPWTVAEQGADWLTLRLSHRPKGEAQLDWPFAFDLEHRLCLSETSLALQMTLLNVDSRPAPAGLGWHPYFPRHDGCALRFAAEAVWQNDAQGLPTTLATISPVWDFALERPLDAPGLDNCFVGRRGPVGIRWPGQGMQLSLSADEALGHLVVFTPPVELGFFAVEPVSHANNALNMPDPQGNGMRLLAPGKRLQVACRLDAARTN
ncbi:aldose 1-epimerase [Pseudomonas sp.]|uniref:aldose 1-epimerase n=1 Tax=Pseudomonas sp. TaxID=306 RepID=UPI0028A86C41|nr:aldose 1-epimerase [Pseudomonas sp.]